MNVLIKKYKQVKGLVFFVYIKIVQIIKILRKDSVYHVIGDSHTTCFLHPLFIIHHIGPSTAYNLFFKKSTTRGKEKVIKILNKIYKNKELNVIFVFGELDTRIHINKIANEKNSSLVNVVDSTVKSYFNFLINIKSKYPLIKMYIFNVLPQGEEENIYNFPYYADRNKWVLIAGLMNDKLKEYAKNNNFKFIDIYDKLINKNGDRKKEYIFDSVHFNRKIMQFVIKELN
jgi:hypothetical protein